MVDMARNLSQAVELIKSFEGIPDGDPATVNLDPYLCPAGYWTIGWGHVVLDPHGKQIKGRENKGLARCVYPGGITKAEAEVLLTDEVQAAFFRLEIMQPVDGAYILPVIPKHQENEQWQSHL